MFRKALALTALTAASAIAVTAGGPPADAAEAAKVMLILDASGSMWGQVEGKTKISIARQTVRDLLAKWDKNIHLGLSAYGHRSKGDCNDIQTLYPVGRADTATILQEVDRLSPKGKTPLTEAVRRAAHELKFTEAKATVILVSDGKETCRADPCAVGKELKKLGVDFTVHVVGFDVRREEQTGLKCLAESTGGLFLSADNATQLNTALKTAVTRVEQDVKKVVAQKPAKSRPAAKPGHRFTAVLVEGGEPVTQGVGWTIYEAEASIEGKRKRVTYSYDARPLFVPNPGKYVMTTKFGSAVVNQPFEVKSGGESAQHTVVLNAGLLATKATFSEGGEDVGSGIGWTIYETEKSLDGKRKRVTYSYDAQPLFRLAAGRYQLVTTRGVAMVTQELEITAGKRTELLVNMNAGLLAPSMLLTEGEKPLTKGTGWTVYELEKNLEGKRKRLTYSYDARPTFTLTEGKYLLRAHSGSAAKETEVEVKAGKRNDATIDLNAGQVKLVANTKEGAQVKKGLGWTIYSFEKNLEGKRKRITYSYDADPIFTLPAAKYHVMLKVGNAVQETTLEVKPGDSKMVEVALQ